MERGVGGGGGGGRKTNQSLRANELETAGRFLYEIPGPPPGFCCCCWGDYKIILFQGPVEILFSKSPGGNELKIIVDFPGSVLGFVSNLT